MRQVVILAIGKKRKINSECQCQHWVATVSFPLSQLLPFFTRVLTVLENDATPEKTWKTIDYQPNIGD